MQSRRLEVLDVPSGDGEKGRGEIGGGRGKTPKCAEEGLEGTKCSRSGVMVLNVQVMKVEVSNVQGRHQLEGPGFHVIGGEVSY